MVYVKAVKDLSSARKLFDEMPDKNLVCRWTSLISGYARIGLANDALELFLRMLEENLCAYVQNGCALQALDVLKSMMERNDCRPNHVTMVNVLSACAEVGDFL